MAQGGNAYHPAGLARNLRVAARKIACALHRIRKRAAVCQVRSGRVRRAGSARKFELAFPRHALERLIGVLDAVLVIGAVGGEQPYDLIGTVAGHVANRTRREVDGLADLKLVFLQRSSPELERRDLLFSSGAFPRSASI
jgi:hypothetical protein